ncbi:MAG TPA: hypothetical protein VK955_04635 [Xanthobacteraceae bacterium]|nr:hypothetical protein [Xanthobacteraceae bacterium]
MPRNSSGVYQLPAGNPVVSGTLIESVWANSTMSDIAQALTDSLDRFGRSTMAAPMLLNDGTLASPGLAFGAESSTGLFRKAAKVLGVSVGGQEIATFTQAGITLPKGIVGALALTGGLTLGADASLTGTGSAGGSWTVGPVGTGGGLMLTGKSATDTWVDLNPQPDNGAAPGTDSALVRVFRFTNTSGTRNFAIFRGDGGTTVDHQFSAGVTGAVAQLARNGGRTLIGTTGDNTIDSLQIVSSARVRQGASGVGSNAAALAGYDEFVIEGSGAVGMSFLSPNTASCGIAWGDPQGLGQGFVLYNHSTDQLQLGAAGTTNLILDAAYTRSTLPFYIPDGTAAAPSLGFMTQATWGMFRIAAIGIGLSVAGAECIRFAAAGATFSAGQSAIMHNDTTSTLSIVAASSLVDNTARVELYDTAHATLARYLALRGKSIVFTDSVSANEKARFSQNAYGELAINTNAFGLWTLANRGLLVIDGSAGALIGMNFGGARCGYITAPSAAEFRISTGVAAMALTLCQNGNEVARVDTDSTFQYTAPTIGQFEVGFRGMPVQSKSAAYTMRAVDRGCCIVQTAVANVITAAVFGAGDVVSISNKSGGAVGLVSTGITLNWGTGTPVTGNRSIANNGFVTLYFTAANVATLTGTGIS